MQNYLVECEDKNLTLYKPGILLHTTLLAGYIYQSPEIMLFARWSPK